MRDRSRLHKTKLNDFLVWVSVNRDYEVLETKGYYEAFRLKSKQGAFVIGHQRGGTDHITVHGTGLFLISEWLKEKR